MDYFAGGAHKMPREDRIRKYQEQFQLRAPAYKIIEDVQSDKPIAELEAELTATRRKLHSLESRHRLYGNADFCREYTKLGAAVSHIRELFTQRVRAMIAKNSARVNELSQQIDVECAAAKTIENVVVGYCRTERAIPNEYMLLTQAFPQKSKEIG